MIIRAAPAKINLALHVIGQREDGYHLLDSLVIFADLGERLHLEETPDLSLSVSGPFAEGVPTGAENLILRAAALFDEPRGARIVLEKHLPHAAGIGGGSSDAAAALLGLCELWHRPLPAPTQILTLGADLPVCLRAPTPQHMRGVGELLEDAPPLPALHLVLVNPRHAVPTPQVFKALKRRNNAPLDPMRWGDAPSFLHWLANQRNDLEAPACQQAPIIGQALQALHDAGAELARMSGSGATCFGLFSNPDAARIAAQEIARQHPNWWVENARALS